VLVTIRCVANLPSLREERLGVAIARQIGLAIKRGIRVNEYSIQDTHLHLLVEADSKEELARGLKFLFSRIAFTVNQIARRAGRVFRDRHHRSVLTKPRQVRNALVYVLFNRRKHLVQTGAAKAKVESLLDRASSVAWFNRWKPGSSPPEAVLERMRTGPCVRGAPPRTWLGRVGWMQHGGLQKTEMPRVAARR